MSENPAEVVRELDEIIEASESETLQAELEITPQAARFAKDFKVDLAKVTGTGTEGRITVSDVEKAYKEQVAAEETTSNEVPSAAGIVSEAGKKEEVANATKVVKPQKKAKATLRNAVDVMGSPSFLPTLRQGLVEIRHIKRTLSRIGTGWGTEYVSREEADEALSQMLMDGWILIHVQALQLVQDAGLEVLWILGKPDPAVEANYPYHEIYHMMRTVGIGDGAVTGLGANELVNARLNDGYDLAYAHAIGSSSAGISMVWVFLR